MEEMKTFNVRLAYESWYFLRKYALDHDTSMNEIIKKYVEKLQKKNEKSVDTE